MLHFKSWASLSQLPEIHPSKSIVQESMSHYQQSDYQPEHDGWVILVEPCDSYEKIINNQTLIGVPWEAVTLQHGHYVCAYVPNNQFVQVVIIQCDDWMDCELKEYLDDHLDF